MSEKNTKARKEYWASLPQEIRKQRMSEVAKKRYEGMSIKNRKLIGRNLALARKRKLLSAGV